MVTGQAEKNWRFVFVWPFCTRKASSVPNQSCQKSYDGLDRFLVVVSATSSDPPVAATCTLYHTEEQRGKNEIYDNIDRIRTRAETHIY